MTRIRDKLYTSIGTNESHNIYIYSIYIYIVIERLSCPFRSSRIGACLPGNVGSFRVFLVWARVRCTPLRPEFSLVLLRLGKRTRARVLVRPSALLPGWLDRCRGGSPVDARLARDIEEMACRPRTEKETEPRSSATLRHFAETLFFSFSYLNDFFYFCRFYVFLNG